MENLKKIEDNEFDKSEQPPVELYDDLPPVSEAKLNPARSLLVALLVREINATLQDINRALAFLDQLEQQTSARPTVSGETIPSPFTEGFVQMIKRSGVEESVREQLTRLQGAAFKANVEVSLRQYWQVLRERSAELNNRVKDAISQTTKKGRIKPEQYQPEQEPPLPVTESAAAQPNQWPNSNGQGWPVPMQPYVQPQPVEPAPGPAKELTVDIFDEPETGEIVVIGEHPGLQPESIRVSLSHDILHLTALDVNGQLYDKEALLPAPVDPRGFRQQFRNGVLEIRFKKF